MSDVDATRTITIDAYTSERLDEIRAAIAELEKLTGFRVDAFAGFDVQNDEHLIHSLIGTTARMLCAMIDEVCCG